MHVELQERPILFNGEMVRAVLDGRKTQTRRVIKPQPTGIDGMDPGIVTGAWHDGFVGVKCPYGQIGDYLWVRESFAIGNDCAPELEIPPLYIYKATSGNSCKWTPSIHMPRQASRITLEITDIRLERVQDISAHDALAEGCIIRDQGPMGGFTFDEDAHDGFGSPQSAFQDLWENISGPESWDANHWVWVVEFKRIK